MNNFTKEELEFIWQKLAIANYDNTEMHDLPNKVCAMIDNYCDHEDYEKLYSSHAGIDNFRCKNCQCQFINEPMTYKKTIVG